MINTFVCPSDDKDNPVYVPGARLWPAGSYGVLSGHIANGCQRRRWLQLLAEYDDVQRPLRTVGLYFLRRR